MTIVRIAMSMTPAETHENFNSQAAQAIILVRILAFVNPNSEPNQNIITLNVLRKLWVYCHRNSRLKRVCDEIA